MDFLCMCVKFNYMYLSMDYPLPLPKSIIGHFFLYACLCDLLPNGGSLTIVDAHGWCVSTITVEPRYKEVGYNKNRLIAR